MNRHLTSLSRYVSLYYAYLDTKSREAYLEFAIRDANGPDGVRI